LPIQDIFWENFYIWALSFSLGQICEGKISNYNSRENFLSFGKSQSVVLETKFILGGLF